MWEGPYGSEVSMGHIFLQEVLAATTLVGGRAEDGVTRARAICEPGFLLCSVAVTALSRAGSGPEVLSRSPKGKIKLIPPPLSVTLLSSQQQHPHPRGNSTGTRRGQVDTQFRPLHMLGDGPQTLVKAPNHF